MNANTLKTPQMDQSAGPKSSPTVNITSSQPSLKPMQRVGGNSVLPKPQVANGASGLAHPGGTADAMGAQDAMQRNMGHFHPSQFPAPQPMMNEQFQGMPLIPGGMPAKKLGEWAYRKEAIGINLMPIVRGAGRLAKGLFKSAPKAIAPEAETLGSAAARTVAHEAGPVENTLIKNVKSYVPHGDPIPVNPPAPPPPPPMKGPAPPPPPRMKAPNGGYYNSDMQYAISRGKMQRIPGNDMPPGVKGPASYPSEGYASGPSVVQGTIRPGRSPAQAAPSSIASPTPSPVGGGQVYAGLGAEGGSSATNPALKSTSRGTKIQGQPYTTQSTGVGIGGSVETPPIASELGDAAGKGVANAAPAPKVPGTSLVPYKPPVAPVATDLGTAAANGAGQAADAAAPSFKRKALQGAAAGAGIAAPVLGTAAAVSANGTENPASPAAPQAQPAPTPQQPQATQPQAPSQQTRPVVDDRSWWQKITGQGTDELEAKYRKQYFESLRENLKKDFHGTINGDPEIKKTYEELMNNPEVRKDIASNMGPMGQIYNMFTSLDPMLQVGLSAALLMAVGGLFGGQSGAVAGGLTGGIGALILQNLPAIMAKLKEIPVGTADPVHTGAQSGAAPPQGMADSLKVRSEIAPPTASPAALAPAA